MERIHVTVRARPLSAEDAKTSPWRISGNSIFIPNHSSKFEFDRIFGEDCKTFEVYQSQTKDIVAAAVRGFNGTVFAYGQTNSGKTHTIRGSATEPGVIPLAVREVFNIIQEDVDREFLLRMSYMEIYNEDINDLLAPEHRKLQIHESLERGIYVAGLREEIVASPEQVLDLMEFGESHRHIGETNMNLYSSRSHTIFRMIIESRDRNEDEDIGSSCDAVRVSVLNLVDLAGSERAAKTGAEGVRLKEGSHINKSLMTLGTVIKKLSEGAESQGGHVPYRDSKLTRILQPALGGNANTAIICNITLAQIHADETKSSLQFASRALRVTNCARVNEILTDAALLKRQKKEIEVLRAKLQESHSEHWAEEILNLRNTLLQTELERERIALELEEEKKAQAEREKMVQQQAKKIENLSSMVLYSNRDETHDRFKKEKRRDTWCPGNLTRETQGEVVSTIQSKASAAKTVRPMRDVGPLLPFQELVHETEVAENESCKEDEECKNITLDDSALPDPCALLHVTNRRKVPPRKKSLPLDNDLVDLQAEYEDLLIKFETQRTLSEIRIDCLTRKLAEADMFSGAMYNDYFTSYLDNGTINGDNNISLRESEAILVIKRLQEQIKMLEMEKSSSQQNLDSVVELATEQNICAREKFGELYEELQIAREEARVAREHPWNESVAKVDDKSSDLVIKLAKEVREIMLEVQSSEIVIESVSSLLDEGSKSFSVLFDTFLDFKTSMCQFSLQQKNIICNHKKLNSYLMEKVSELENEKCLLYNQTVDLQNQIEELKLDAQNSEKSLRELLEQQDLEKGEYLSYMQVLEKEISGLSSCSLAKEKESLRKDVEKTRMKLKETEFKLKNAIQEKTKLEGEKASAEREIKRLHGQNSLLERDMNKRDSLAGRRRDSVMSDSKRTKNLAFEQTMQEEYKKMEVYAFEMETKMTSLEEELAAVYREKEDAVSISEGLASDLENLSEKLSTSNLELDALQEELLALKQRLEESEFEQQKMEGSIKMFTEEKEDLAMQLTDSLLEMEEERAIWSAKEKASIEAIEDKSKVYNMEITSLSREMSEVRNELESCREECKILRERLTSCEETAGQKMCSMEKSFEIDQVNNDENITGALSKRSEEMLSSNSEMCGIQQCEEVNMLRKELSFLSKEREGLLTRIRELSELSNDYQSLNNQLCVMSKEKDKLVTQIEEQQKHAIEEESLNKRYNDLLMEAKFQVEELTRRISSMELKIHKDQVENGIEKAKLRMRLRGAQAKLDAFRSRYKETRDESDHMNKKFEEDDETDNQARDKQIQRIHTIFHRQLSVPHVNMRSTLLDYKAWEVEQGNILNAGSSDLDGISSHVASAYKKALEMYNARVHLEEQICRQDMSDSEKLQNFMNYLKFEQSSGDPSRVQMLYERAITEFPISSYLWLDYTHYLDKTLKVGSIITNVFSRAVKNCPCVGELWVRYLLSLERGHASEKEIAAVFEKSLQCILTLDEFLDLYLTRIDGLRRRISCPVEGESVLDYSLIRETFQNASDYFSQYLKNTDGLLRLHAYWARLEINLHKDLQAARGVWESLLKICGSMLEAWQGYITMEAELGHVSEARSLYRRCYSKRFPGTGSEDICYSWLRFEREFGSLDDFDRAVQKVTPRLEELQLFRSQQESKLTEEGENSSKKNVRDKRKQVPEIPDEHYPAKRQKDASQKPKKAHGKDSDVLNPGEQTVEKIKPKGDKPDIQNEQRMKERVPEKTKVYADQCTAFVSNINLKANDEHLRQFFSDVGGVVAIRLLHDKFSGKSRGLAYVDFSDDAHLVAAVAKSKQMLLGKKLSIARSDPKHGKKEHARGSESRESAETSNGPRAHQALQSSHNRGSDNVQLRGRNTFAIPRNVLALGQTANKPKTEEQGEEKPKSNDEFRNMFLKG